MSDTYEQVRRAVTAAGFATTVMPMPDGGTRFVCASCAGRIGLTGNSFWVTERGGRWYLGLWTPRLYEIPDSQRVAEFCVTCLRHHPNLVIDLDPNIREAFDLVALDPAQELLPPAS